MRQKIEQLIREMLQQCIVNYNDITDSDKKVIIKDTPSVITNEIICDAESENSSFLQSMLGEEASGSQFGASFILQKLSDRLVHII